jgi:lysozyme family protein
MGVFFAWRNHMQSVDEITAEIVDREGGYVNDPDDPGGATKYGVTIHTLRRVRGSASIEDVKALTIQEAMDIYKRYYFELTKINQLPQPLQATVYDMQVNSGGNAVKILQRIFREFGENVSVDGVLGPQSIAASVRVEEIAGGYLVDAYGIARRNYYFRLADRTSKSRKYARTRAGGKGGWIKRAEDFMGAKYHMTDSQFKCRVSKWA